MAILLLEETETPTEKKRIIAFSGVGCPCPIDAGRQLVTPEQGFANFIDAITFPEPLEFPQDYYIVCNDCGDAMVSVEWEELVTTAPNTIARWTYDKFECRNCSTDADEGHDDAEQNERDFDYDMRHIGGQL